MIILAFYKILHKNTNDLDLFIILKLINSAINIQINSGIIKKYFLKR